MNLMKATALLLGLCVASARSAPGDLDSTFGIAGKVTLDLDHISASALAIQTDGKIVVVGRRDFVITRLNPNGSLDLTFGNAGVVVADFGFFDEAFDVAIQPDGKILVVGCAACNGFALARFHPNGTPDSSFDTDGKVTTTLGSCSRAFAVALQRDGKIVAVGHSEVPEHFLTQPAFAVVRYNSDGSLDANFGDAGKVITDFGGSDYANGVAIQEDGKIVVAGSGGNYDFALARYNPDGRLDMRFGTRGKVLTDLGGGDAASDLVLQADGKIVLAGVGGLYLNFALTRYNTDGRLDSTFGVDGKVAAPFFPDSYELANAITIQPNGKLLAAGFASVGSDPSFAIARYNSDGSLDFSFGMDGLVTTDFGNPADVGVLCPPGRKDCSEDRAEGIAIQADGKIVVVGGGGASMPPSLLAIARYEGGPPDSDQDGVADEHDVCPDTAPTDIVNSQGCSIGQLVPCAGPVSGGKWKSHGRYVVAVSGSVRSFLAAGLLTEDQAHGIVTSAANSNCGKPPITRLIPNRNGIRSPFVPPGTYRSRDNGRRTPRTFTPERTPRVPGK